MSNLDVQSVMDVIAVKEILDSTQDGAPLVAALVNWKNATPAPAPVAPTPAAKPAAKSSPVVDDVEDKF